MEIEEKKKIVEEVLQYPTGNISDAMDNLGIRRGAIAGAKAEKGGRFCAYDPSGTSQHGV